MTTSNPERDQTPTLSVYSTGPSRPALLPANSSMIASLIRSLFRRHAAPSVASSAPSSPVRTIDSVRRAQTESARIAEAEAKPGAPAWRPRSAEYWQARTSRVIQRLEYEWAETGDTAKWPDVAELLSLLAAEPEAVIRQLPAAARDAITICDDANLSRNDLADRLGNDPSLVQGLLRQANGAWYGAGLQPVLRVDAAIDRIGIAGTRAVVLASCVDGLLAKPGDSFDAMVGAVWSHMVQTAPLARSLAPLFGADPEEAFAVSLLHDVGKLVMFDRIASLRQARRRAVLLPDHWLSQALEHLHEPLGASAVHQWRLGAAAADAIGRHHRKERPSSEHPLAEVLFLAERVDHACRKETAFDVEGIWALGELHGDITSCRALLARQIRVAA